MFRTAVLFALLAVTPLAQHPATGFVPGTSVATLVAEDIPTLLAQVQQGAIGRLLADEEVAAAWDLAVQRSRRLAAGGDALSMAALAMDLELEPWLAGQLLARVAAAAFRNVELAEIQRAEFSNILVEHEGDAPGTPIANTATFTCPPRAEGRWTALFERQAKLLADTKLLTAVPELKFAGFPALGFRLQPRAAPDAAHPDAAWQDPGFWLLHLPGQFAYGATTPERVGTLGPLPQKGVPRVGFEMNLQAYGKLFSKLGGGAPREFEALGFDALKSLRWQARCEGKDICSQLEVELVGEPKGIVGALLAGKAALPAQPLPEDALLQLRAAVDLPMLLAAAEGLGIGDVVPAVLRAQFAKAFTGGIAIGVVAPAPGAIVPRIHLSLGIADAKAVTELIGMILGPGAAQREFVHEGVACTALRLPELPPALQPAFCTVDGVLHLAESAGSLRSFLSARGGGSDAMAIGDAPIPAGPGELLPTFDVRCDEQALYRAFHAAWLPFVKLIPFEDGMRPLLQADEMPPPDAVLPRLGRSRGVLRRDGKVFRLQQQGPLGGLECAALAMTWAPIVSAVYFQRDYATRMLAQRIAHVRLERLWTAIAAFEQQHSRRPHDLAELMVAMQLPADALLVPGDEMAEAVPMPAGDTKDVRSSFRYFADGVAVDVQGVTQTMLLVALAPHPYNRPMLTADGAQPEVFGPVSSQSIDRFGK